MTAQVACDAETEKIRSDVALIVYARLRIIVGDSGRLFDTVEFERQRTTCFLWTDVHSRVFMGYGQPQSEPARRYCLLFSKAKKPC